jgi:hypothetical protein
MASEPRSPEVNASFPKKIVEADHKRFSVVMHNNIARPGEHVGGNQNFQLRHYPYLPALAEVGH